MLVVNHDSLKVKKELCALTFNESGQSAFRYEECYFLVSKEDITRALHDKGLAKCYCFFEEGSTNNKSLGVWNEFDIHSVVEEITVEVKILY